MLVRMAGCDAEVTFDPILFDVIKRMEARFPWPEYAVMFADAQQEDASDMLILGRRYSGVLIPMVYLTIDDINAAEAVEGDWMADIEADLARTEEEIQKAIEAEKASAAAGDQVPGTQTPGPDDPSSPWPDDPHSPGLRDPEVPDFDDSSVAALRDLEVPGFDDALKADLGDVTDPETTEQPSDTPDDEAPGDPNNHN